MVYGILIVLISLFYPGGLIGLVRKILHRRPDA